MSKKSGKIADLIHGLRGQAENAHYLGFFECFNRGLYYEAHDVLEELWLSDRNGPNYAFYKGLIQLAGAFVHLQKNRLKPSLALFNLAQKNLTLYPSHHERLNLLEVLGIIHDWSDALIESDFTLNPLNTKPAPLLHLMKCSPIQQGTLVIATRNKHKLQEIQKIMGDHWRYLNLLDLPGAPEVLEDQATFDGNAQKKSLELAQWIMSNGILCQSLAFPLLILADDSGLAVDALNGAPGVYSARFAAMDSGEPGNSADSENNAKLLRLLHDVPAAKRSARFHCVLALTEIETPYSPQAEWKIKTFDGICEGVLAFEASGQGGFGYDPLFVPAGFEVSFAALGEEIKNRISHRSNGLSKLKSYLGA